MDCSDEGVVLYNTLVLWAFRMDIPKILITFASVELE